MGELISRTSWMRDIPDDTPATTLNIPGTHNSCCVAGVLGLAKTQNVDLPDQLNAGIRFLDIRLTHYRNNLCVHHDMICTEKSYTDVLTDCANFLRQYPSETVVMSVADEGRFDSALGKLAPSRIMCKLPVRDNEDCDEDCDESTRSFQETFTEKTRKHPAGATLFYNFATTSTQFTSKTTLGELRGKIVLLRRFEGSQDVGLDLTYWPDNQRFRSAAPPFYDIEDRYQSPGDDEKFDFVVTHLTDARNGDPEDLYITFSSAVDLTAGGYAEVINPRLNDYLAKSPPGRLGIIVMDYFDEPPELVSNVIKTNVAAAAGDPGGARRDCA